MKKIFTRLNIVRTTLLIGAVIVILAVLPRAGHQSFSYEINQPWKYHLLTAEFDIPIYRDQETAQRLKDSIERAFVPFVYTDNDVAEENIARLHTLLTGKVSASDLTQVENGLRAIYKAGIAPQSLLETVRSRGQTQLRTLQDNTDEPTSATFVDMTAMTDPASVFHELDSIYRTTHGGALMSAELAKGLSMSVEANVDLDTITNNKFQDQEFLALNAAQGVIKKGQRIVDLGEIVSPQIYTNLRTYESMLSEKQMELHHSYYIYGQAFCVLLCYLIFWLYLANYRPKYYNSIRIMTFLMTYTMLFVIFSIVMFESFTYGIYLVPFAAVPIVVLVFFDARTAVMSLITTVLISAMVATFPFQFILLEMTAGLVGTYCLRQLSRRSQLLISALLCFITYVAGYAATILLNSGTFETFSTRAVGMLGINCILLSFAYFLILLIEKIFGFTSTVTLVELSDINNKLLRRLAEEAPGTFQHSIQISTMAAEAARAIGANVQLVRTGALYHDIGKVESPVFFTENQHGVNPHDGLDPEVSARKIISHVTAGLQLATKEKLPKVIRDFISQHHGKGMTKYFYTTARNSQDDSEVDNAAFTYPGPNPNTKETTLLMIADAVEASSRSLPDYSEESISELVDRIIDSQIADGLYNDSPISFADIQTVKETFKRRLAAIYHSRVAYPKLISKSSDAN